MALLGLGASGVFVYRTPELHARKRLSSMLVIYGGLFATLSLLLMVAFLLTPLGASAVSDNVAVLLLAYLVGAGPFFAGGAFLALAIRHFHEDVNRVYGADLLGAACGCLLLIPVLNTLGGAGPPLLAAALGLLAALLAGAASRRIARTLILVSIGILAAVLLAQATGRVVEVSYAKGERIPTPLFSGWNSYSRIAVYPHEPAHWGLSAESPQQPPPSLRIDIDAAAATPILIADSATDVGYLRYDISGLGYRILTPGGHALVIGPGGGRDIWSALIFGAEKVTGVEINSIIVDDVMGGAFREISGGIYHRPGVTVHRDDGRNFIASTTQKYDLIQASLVDTWAASSAGAFALTENNLYTVEAFVTYLEHLEPGGVLTVTRFRPEALRLVTLSLAAVSHIEESAAPGSLEWPSAASRLFVAASPDFGLVPGLATLILKNGELTDSEISQLADETQRLGFEVLYTPGGASGLPSGAAEYVALVTAEDPSMLYEASEVDISPVTDDRPFFFQTARVDGLIGLLRSAFGSSVATSGIAVLTRLLIVSALLITAFVLVPLRYGPRRTVHHATSGASNLSYFALIGVGFMLIEIGLIQRFVLFLGHPVYALTVVLFTFLLAAGTGSMVSRRFSDPGRAAAIALGTVVSVSLVYAVVLPSVLSSLLGIERGIRISLSVFLLFPFGVLLGMPLPLGVQMLGRRSPHMVAWAWGINGAASVIGSTLAILVALVWGLTTVALAASVFYAGAAFVVRWSDIAPIPDRVVGTRQPP